LRSTASTTAPSWVTSNWSRLPSCFPVTRSTMIVRVVKDSSL